MLRGGDWLTSLLLSNSEFFYQWVSLFGVGSSGHHRFLCTVLYLRIAAFVLVGLGKLAVGARSLVVSCFVSRRA